MIRYALTCARNHDFESWFQSAEAYDSLLAAGHVTCALCGTDDVRKSLMAPALRPLAGGNPTGTGTTDLMMPQGALAEKLAALKREIETNAEYVGTDFATEARAIHDGDAPSRAIYGEALREDAKKLIEDGVPVAPLPFVPQRRVN